MKPKHLESFLTANQTAMALNISRSMLSYIMRVGTPPHHVRHGGRLYFDPDSVNAYRERRETPPGREIKRRAPGKSWEEQFGTPDDES